MRRNSRTIKTLSSAPRRAATSCWANGQLGSWEFSGPALAEYVKSILRADLQEKGDEDVFRKLRKDFDEGGVKVADAEIRAMMGESLAKAVVEIEASGPKG